jgi:CheY-like chemotaxis protein
VPTDARRLVERAVAAAGDDPDRPIRVQIADDLPPVQSDEDRILQVLANLLSNARKYSPQGGIIEVSARVVEESVELAVRDHGLGLPPEALPRLFESFYRVEHADRRAIGGTGLGLAISKKIVEAHGGRIWAEAAGPGQGSTFRFTLPLVMTGAVAGEVLIVEDDVGFARLLEAELEARGHTSARATSAEAALERLALARPRAILLDLRLPNMSGAAFLRRLRERGEADMPVVVVSVADLSSGAIGELEGLGVVAVLRKAPGVAVRCAELVAEYLHRDETSPGEDAADRAAPTAPRQPGAA